MRALILLLLLTAGCASPFNDLKGRMKPEYDKGPQTIEAVIETYFQPGVHDVLKSIPCVDGFTMGGSYVVGVNFWSTMAGILTGSGYSRKVVTSKKALWNWGQEEIIHEYLHHLDDLSRDGDGDYINYWEFQTAYIRLALDPKWAGYAIYAAQRADSAFTDFFGIGYLSEHIAYLGARLAVSGKGPDYIWKVYEKVLKR